MELSVLLNEKDIGKEFAKAISIQTEVANRAWLALIAAAAFTILPHEVKPGYIALPFNFGEIPASLFHPVAFCILVVIALAFAAAHARHLDIQEGMQSALDKLPDHERDAQRKLFDISRKPSLMLVSPLAWVVKGSRKPASRWRRLLAGVYYWLLKLTSLIVYIFMPIAALWTEEYSASRYTRLWYGLVFGACLSTIALLQVCWADLKYAWGTHSRLQDRENLKPETRAAGVNA